MQVNMEKLVHMKIQWKTEEPLVRTDPNKYKKHLRMENGSPVLYMKLRKLLYGTLELALMF